LLFFGADFCFLQLLLASSQDFRLTRFAAAHDKRPHMIRRAGRHVRIQIGT
jgi:hypothetical protein